MSLRVQTSSLVVVVVVVCLLCGAWTLGSVHVSGAPGNDDAVTAVVYGDLESPADSASFGEQADPEDADSLSAARDLQVIAPSVSVPLTSAERIRSTRPDRPPRLARLG